MGLVNKTALKAYFQEGDIPIESNFIDVFDSVLGLHGDDDQTVAGHTTFSDQITTPKITTTTSLNVGDGTYSAPIKLKETGIVSVSTSGTTTDINNFFTKNMVPLSISVTVTTEIGNNGYIDHIGTDGDDDAFCTSIGNGKLEDAGDEVTCMATFPANGAFFTGNDKLRFTHNATPTQGAIRAAMVYIDGDSVYTT